MKAALARWRAAPDAPPPGHRPGAIAARVLADLRAEREADGAAGLTARLPNGVRVTIGERVERQFLMHTVSVKVAATACGPAVQGSARVRQTGWLRSTGIDAVAVPGCDPGFVDAVAALVAEPSLADALRPLHLTDCTIDARDGRWTLAIVPFGGSEVVNRMPSFRRYVRLTGEQAAALSAACLAFETALRRILHG
ncbi:DUF3156 family protein [Burkholderia contaminans]|uniref:DUF3156 family protein n=2 Tax=Burkholderia contaminans TaxID=488447 RepID=A0A3N8Q7U4_9BURK|nr:DUF3156 family protein [Burkholderia contaminans]MCA8155027.1 DUF3156 family protein [Burkholderia contaminans]RQT03139.1 DUF3156 family protein [Burkholderia contaminans]RQT26166.1 DUF3156 family protein [Burkholderia contaminans]VWC99086.1 hypothetical protein BCO18430_03797 [Burkholderia contaminans]HEM7874861.1 DUF3156 family protein [Burkholderia contaminans]